MSVFDLLGLAAALINPATADYPTLIALAVGALLILPLVAVATAPTGNHARPSVDELADLNDRRWDR